MNIKKTNILIASLAFALVFVTGIAQLQAADTNWTGGTGDWDVSGNWDSGVPTSSDSAEIGSSGVVTIQSGTSAATAQLSGMDGHLKMRGDSLNTSGIQPQSGTSSLTEVYSGSVQTGTTSATASYRDLSGGTAKVELYDGGTWSAPNGSFRLGSSGGTGNSKLTIHTGARMDIDSNLGDNRGRVLIGEGSAGTFKAVLGRKHPSSTPLLQNDNDPEGYESGLDLGGASYASADAHLETGLEGGVMLSPNNSHLLIDVENTNDWGSQIDGSWTSAPGDNAGDLWTTTTGSHQVSIALNTSVDRGTLDASQPGSSSVAIGSPSADGVKGYVDVTNMSTEVLELGLDFSSEKTSALLDELQTDLQNAGYSFAELGYSGYDIGLGMDWDSGTDGNFAFDFSEYTGSALELTSVAVIPEPASFLLLGLGGLLLMNRRRRRC